LDASVVSTFRFWKCLCTRWRVKENIQKLKNPDMGLGSALEGGTCLLTEIFWSVKELWCLVRINPCNCG
jgi:hypothetical protein